VEGNKARFLSTTGAASKYRNSLVEHDHRDVPEEEEVGLNEDGEEEG